MRLESEAGYTGPVRGGYVSQSRDRYYVVDGNGNRHHLPENIAIAVVALAKATEPYFYDMRHPGRIGLGGVYLTSSEYGEAKALMQRFSRASA